MDALARMIDANANRAAEGLRVLEDLARFALSDAHLAGSLKTARHDLRRAVEGLGLEPIQLIASRDTPGDVGTTIGTPDELTRRGMPAIASAAAKRAAEALRVLEECAKALTDATPFERLRYELYDNERALSLALSGGRARQWRLCVLITESLCSPHSWAEVARGALEAGADCLQLREKSLDAADLVRRARQLIALARPCGATVIVNDRPDVALAAGADGVHLGQADLEPSIVRAMAGSRLLIGVSTSGIEQAHRAIRDGADYCGVGPMFPSQTKRREELSGERYLREYLADPRCARIPHLAIGGIDADNIAALVRAGCRGVAVTRAVTSSSDPGVACQALISALHPETGEPTSGPTSS